MVFFPFVCHVNFLVGSLSSEVRHIRLCVCAVPIQFFNFLFSVHFFQVLVSRVFMFLLRLLHLLLPRFHVICIPIQCSWILPKWKIENSKEIQPPSAQTKHYLVWIHIFKNMVVVAFRLDLFTVFRVFLLLCHFILGQVYRISMEPK